MEFKIIIGKFVEPKSTILDQLSPFRINNEIVKKINNFYHQFIIDTYLISANHHISFEAQMSQLEEIAKSQREIFPYKTQAEFVSSLENLIKTFRNIEGSK